MKAITISSRNGDVSEKQLLYDPETSAQGLGRGFGQPVYPPGDKTVLGCTQVGVYFQSPEGQKENSW